MAHESLTNWLEDQQQTFKLKAEQVDIKELQPDWQIRDQAFQREDQKFFRLIGAKISAGINNVKSWVQPLLEELGSHGVVAIVQEEVNGKILITAKQDPGNYSEGGILLAPSFQASAANMERAHGGDAPQLAKVLDMEGARTVHQSIQHRDGARFLGKKTDVRVIRVPSQESIKEHVGDNQRWSTVEEVKEAIRDGLKTNPFLRETILQLLVDEKPL